MALAPGAGNAPFTKSVLDGQSWIRKTILISLSVALLLMILGLSLVSYSRELKHARDSAIARATSQATAIAIASEFASSDVALQRIVAAFAAERGVISLRVIERGTRRLIAGKSVWNSDTGRDSGELPAIPPELFAGDVEKSLYEAHTRRIWVKVPMSIESYALPGALGLSSYVLLELDSRSVIEETLDSTWDNMLVTLLLMIFPALILLSAIERNVVRPIQSVVRTIESRRNGQKDVFSGIEISGEIGFLSGQLDELLRELDSRQRIIENQSLQLIHSVKMASLGEMAAGIAHEINTPLSVIHSNADMMGKLIHKDPINRENLQTKLERISSTAVRISKIIKGLRSFSRSGESSDFQFIGADALIQEVLSLCGERFASHNIDLQVYCQSSEQIRTKGPQISQILLNLLSNGFDAVSGLTEKWVRLEFESDADVLRFRVTDSGSGISREIAERMMDPFFTTKELGKGTGLGLSISVGIARDHGGRLTYNTNCSNTQFVLELPRFC